MIYLRKFTELFEFTKSEGIELIKKINSDPQKVSYKLQDSDGNKIDLHFTDLKNGTTQIKFGFEAKDRGSNQKKDFKYYINLLSAMMPYAKEYLEEKKPIKISIGSTDPKRMRIYKSIFSKEVFVDYFVSEIKDEYLILSRK